MSAHRLYEVLGVDGARKKLDQQHPRKAELVKLRFFAGLSVEQAAKTLDSLLECVRSLR